MSDSFFLHTFKLKDFKNHEQLTCTFSPAFNGISGLNGKGKTNLLDAIHYLLTGKSYFHHNDRMNIRKETELAFISGVFEAGDVQTKVSISIPTEGAKQLKTDGIPCKKLSDFIGKFSVVMLTPDDISIVNGGGEFRRNFIDRIICQFDRDYLTSLNRYMKLVDQRNQALKKMDETGIFNADWIQTYDQQLCVPAQAIYQTRKKFMLWISPVAANIYKDLTEDRDLVEIQYVSSLDEMDFLSLMKHNQSKDRVLCRTTSGIHKDDIMMTLEDGLDLRKYGSQGQVKSWVMSLKLAAMSWLKEFKQQTPVLLLDDVFEKIDDTRLKNLLVWLEKNHHGQWFVTDAHKMRLQEYVSTLRVEKKFFNIDESFHESGETHQASIE